MSVIYVKAKTGRLARTSLRGSQIPYDDFVPVVVSKHINRLIANGDIEIEKTTAPKHKAEKPKVEAVPPSAPAAPVATPPTTE